MTHVETLLLFTELFHVKYDELDAWFPNGMNSVRIRLKQDVMLPFNAPKVDLIFTGESREDWKLETIESWLKDKGENV